MKVKSWPVQNKLIRYSFSFGGLKVLSINNPLNESKTFFHTHESQRWQYRQKRRNKRKKTNHPHPPFPLKNTISYTFFSSFSCLNQSTGTLTAVKDTRDNSECPDGQSVPYFPIQYVSAQGTQYMLLVNRLTHTYPVDWTLLNYVLG